MSDQVVFLPDMPSFLVVHDRSGMTTIIDPAAVDAVTSTRAGEVMVFTRGSDAPWTAQLASEEAASAAAAEIMRRKFSPFRA